MASNITILIFSRPLDIRFDYASDKTFFGAAVKKAWWHILTLQGFLGPLQSILFFIYPVFDYFSRWLLINAELFMFALATDALLISIALRRVFMPRTTVVWTAGWSTVSQISPGINKSWTTVGILPLTGFPSPALPCDEDALVLVLVPQWTVGLICQSVAGGQKKHKVISLHVTSTWRQLTQYSYFPGCFWGLIYKIVV